MTSSNTFKKFISIGAAALLAIGGSALPAQATNTNPLNVTVSSTYAPSSGQTARVGNSLTNLGVSTFTPAFNGSGVQLSNLTFDVVWFACDTAKSTIATDTTDGTTPSGTFRTDCHVITVGAPTNSSYVIDQTYLGKYIGVWTKATDSVSGGWAAFSSATTGAVQAALPTATTHASIATTTGTANQVGATITATDTVWTSGSGSGKWYVCTNGGAPSVFVPMDCNALQVSSSDTSAVTTATYTIPSIFYCGQVCTVAGVSSTGRYLRWGSVNQTVPDLSGTYGPITSTPSGGGGGAPSSGTLTAAPSTPVITNGVATVTQGTWSGSVSLTRGWKLCSTASTAATGSYFASPPQFSPSTCKYFIANPITSATYGSSDIIQSNPLTVPATVNLVTNCVSSGGSSLCTTTSTSTTGMYLAWYEFDNGVWAISAAVDTAGTVSNQNNQQQNNQQQNSQQQQSAPEAPTWQAPIVNQVPNLSKAVTTAGGQITLKDDSFTGLKSVTVGGKPVSVTVGANGSVIIPVPAGQTGAADLTLTFDTGTITIIDGIKYVAPVDVAAVPIRDIAVAAGSTKVTTALADQIRQAAFANMTNNSIQCVAYAANGSASAKAAAAATATQACALAVKANPGLQVTAVNVVVNKAKARKTGVGIKVYKQN